MAMSTELWCQQSEGQRAVPEVWQMSAELWCQRVGPEVTLFKTLKNSWDSLELSNIILPDIPTSYRTEAEELLLFIDEKLQPGNLEHLPRCMTTRSIWSWQRYSWEAASTGRRDISTSLSVLEQIIMLDGCKKLYTS